MALDALEPDAVAAEWLPIVQGATRTVALIAVEADEVVGFLAYEPRDNVAEVHTLVVDPDARHRGHASRLMSAFADHMREQHVSDASMWCPAADEPLRNFLISCGWAPDGARRTLADGSFQGDEERFVTTFIGESPALAGP